MCAQPAARKQKESKLINDSFDANAYSTKCAVGDECRAKKGVYEMADGKIIRDWFEVTVKIKGKFSVIRDEVTNNDVESVLEKVELDIEEWLEDYFESIDSIGVALVNHHESRD